MAAQASPTAVGSLLNGTYRLERIIAEGGIAGVEHEIASVADVFALQDDARMREIEKKYLR